MSISAGEILMAMYSRYEHGKYVIIPEAPQANAGGRRCDAIAIGVWGSTGNEIIGHEIKVSRADWQKELEDPTKCEAFTKHCHRWYITAPTGLISPDELRPAWGLLEYSTAGKLKVRRQAEKVTTEPIPSNMLASWMRRVVSGERDVMRKQIEANVRKELESRYERDSKEKTYEKRYMELANKISEFEKASGLYISGYDRGKIADAVHALMHFGESPLERINHVVSTAKKIAEQSEKYAAELAAFISSGK